jgi:hypothetical protein
LDFIGAEGHTTLTIRFITGVEYIVLFLLLVSFLLGYHWYIFLKNSNFISKMSNRVEQLKEIQQNALELFTRKNADYGDAFAKFGLIGVLMRIEDKIQRSLSITKTGVTLVDDEGLRDTLLDLHNYAAMGLMLIQ